MRRFVEAASAGVLLALSSVTTGAHGNVAEDHTWGPTCADNFAYGVEVHEYHFESCSADWTQYCTSVCYGLCGLSGGGNGCTEVPEINDTPYEPAYLAIYCSCFS